MNRRHFVGASLSLMAGVRVHASGPDETATIRSAVEAYYAAYRGLDKAKYRARVTEDYLLLENGEILEINGDLALRGAPGSGYQRTDAFDFRSVKVHGGMILRRSGRGWRTALLHSTRLSKPSA